MRRDIHEISGVVEITTGKKKEQLRFASAIVAGSTRDEVFANFKYDRAFWDKSKKAKARELQAEGRVRLIDFDFKQRLGLQ